MFLYFLYSLDHLCLSLYHADNCSVEEFSEHCTLEIGFLHGHTEFQNAENIEFLVFESDNIIRVTWDKSSHCFKQFPYKIKMSRCSDYIVNMVSGEKYSINESTCPSFLAFTKCSEVFLGIIIEDTIKFWSVSCDLRVVESSIFCEELDIFFLSSRDKSGFYSVLLALK